MTPEQFAKRLQAGIPGIAKALTAAGIKAASAGEKAAMRRARTVPKIRSGALLRSIHGAYAVAPGASLTITLRAGGGSESVKYARIQEKGGTVTPKRGKYLRIPLRAAKYASGVDKFAGPLRQALPGLFVLRAKSGKLFLVRPKGKGKNRGLEFLYLLVASSTIRPHPYLLPSMDDVAASLRRNLGTAIRAELP